MNIMRRTSIVLVIMVLVLIPSVAFAETSIVIDGYYDDWADKPHTSFTYGGWNGLDTNDVALFIDDTYIYGHIKKSDVSGLYYPTSYMYLRVNDQYTVPFDINIDKAKGGNINKLAVGLNLNLATYDLAGKKSFLGNAAITIYNKSHSIGDEVEFAIELENIRSLCNNITTIEMKTLTLYCSNLGSQTITVTGTSTGPFMGIVVTIVVVGLLVLLRKKRHTVT